jgi:hypothetical protein
MSKITHFADKAWLVTWERQSGGFGCYQYGVVGIYNKPNLAQTVLNDLVSEENKKGFYDNKTSYCIKEVGLNENKQLFEFLY